MTTFQEFLTKYYPDKNVNEIELTGEKRNEAGALGALTGTLDLTGYNNLTSFQLNSNNTNDDQYFNAIQAIPNKAQITNLRFYNQPIKDPNFTYLANNFPNLTSLSFHNSSINKEINFKDLTKLTKLKGILLGDGNQELLIRALCNIPPLLTHWNNYQILNNPLTPYFAQLGNPKMSLLLQRNKNIQQLKDELKDQVLVTTSRTELIQKWSKYKYSLIFFQLFNGEHVVAQINSEKKKVVVYYSVINSDWQAENIGDKDQFLQSTGLKVEYTIAQSHSNSSNNLTYSGFLGTGIIEKILSKIKKGEKFNIGDGKKDQGENNNYAYDLGEWTIEDRTKLQNQLQKEYDAQPNIDLTQYQEKHTDKDLKPTDLPDNWKTELARIPELEKRPTQEQLNQAVQGEKDKYNNLPTDWKAKLDEFLEVEKGRIKTELPAFFQSVAVGIDNIKKRFENDEEWKKQNGITVFDYEDIISKKLTLDNKENMRGDFKLVSCICATEKVGDTIENLSPTAKKNYLPTIKKVQAGWEKVELYQQIGAKNSPFYLDIIKQRQVYKTKIEKWINEIESQNLQTQPPK